MEIENYTKLKDYLRAKKVKKIDETLIKKIHSIIMQNIDDDGAGEYRRVAVGIGGLILNLYHRLWLKLKWKNY